MNGKDLFLSVRKSFSVFLAKISNEANAPKLEQMLDIDDIIDNEIVKAATRNLIQDLQNVLKGSIIENVTALESHMSEVICRSEVICMSESADQHETETHQRKRKPIPVSNHLVQIQADKGEIERRINAFVEKKRLEADNQNVREFCNVMKVEPVRLPCADMLLEDKAFHIFEYLLQELFLDEESCARTDAMYMARVDGKSHVRVTRVNNQYGPQMMILPTLHSSPAKPKSSELKPRTTDGLEERLHNIEEHLHIDKGKLSGKNVHERLQTLENRILHLESLSPEYFTYQFPDKKLKSDLSIAQPYNQHIKQEPPDMNLGDIDQRIYLLRQSLMARKQIGSSIDIKAEPQ